MEVVDDGERPVRLINKPTKSKESQPKESNEYKWIRLKLLVCWPTRVLAEKSTVPSKETTRQDAQPTGSRAGRVVDFLSEATDREESHPGLAF